VSSKRTHQILIQSKGITIRGWFWIKSISTAIRCSGHSGMTGWHTKASSDDSSLQPQFRPRSPRLRIRMTANTFCTLLGRLLKANRTMSMLARLIPPRARKSSRQQAMQSTQLRATCYSLARAPCMPSTSTPRPCVLRGSLQLWPPMSLGSPVISGPEWMSPSGPTGLP